MLMTSDTLELIDPLASSSIAKGLVPPGPKATCSVDQLSVIKYLPEIV
jgi:hypothetical protein